MTQIFAEPFFGDRDLSPKDYVLRPVVRTYVLPDADTRFVRRNIDMGAFLDFTASASTDVVEYRLYYEEDPGVVGYNSAFVSLGNPTPGADGVISVDLTTVREFTNLDGIYELGVTSVDDAGNESTTMTVVPDVPLDFVAPAAPADAIVRFT